MIIFDLYNETPEETESKPPSKEEEEKLKQKLLLEVLYEQEALQVVNIYGEFVSY